jgi:hypothetical protein
MAEESPSARVQNLPCRAAGRSRGSGQSVVGGAPASRLRRSPSMPSSPPSPRSSSKRGLRLSRRSPLIPPSITTWAMRRPCGPNSRAMLCAIARRPAFAAAKCAHPGLPRRLPEAPVKITVARPSGASRRAASRPTRKPPKQPTRQNSFKVSALSARKSWRRLLPALKTTRSAGAKPSPGAMARSKRRRMSRSLVVSVWLGAAARNDDGVHDGFDFACRAPRSQDLVPGRRKSPAQRRAQSLLDADNGRGRGPHCAVSC